jgi:hypothetical protein
LPTDAQVTGDRHAVTYTDNSKNTSDRTIVFGKAKASSTPMLPVVAVAAVLVGAALLRRRA